MAAAAATNSKRLPKELQTYKREVKGLPFKEKVKAFFNLSPYQRDIDSQKKEVILSTFTREERAEFERLYRPIYSGIERYGDRMRAFNSNIALYSFYIDSVLRQSDTIRYTADFFNRILPTVGEALEGTKEESTRKALTEAYRKMKEYRVVTLPMLSPEMGMNKNQTEYEVDSTKIDQNLRENISLLKGLLSLLKCYLEALREFLVWVGTPELYPKEFEDMENRLKTRYKPIQKGNIENPNAKEFPLWSSTSEVVEEYISIDYDALPRSVDIFGDNNLFANTYRSFFNY